MIATVRRYCLLFPAALVILASLTACSENQELSMTQDEFQNAVASGFTAPQIVTVELPAATRAHLYLETPVIQFADSRRVLEWVIPGEVDVDFAGQLSSGRMTLVLQGRGELEIQADERTVFLSNVTIAGKDIAVQSNLVQMLVLDAMAEVVATRLNHLLLFTAPEDSPLAGLMKGPASQGLTYQIEPGRIVFKRTESVNPS